MAKADGHEHRQVERMARGYLALTAGDAGRALRLLAADRLAEINARAHLRRVAVNRRLREEGQRDVPPSWA